MAGKTTNLQLQKIDNTDYAGNFPTIYNNNLDLIDVLNNKQDKLIAGSGITIASDGKTISSSGKEWKVSNKSIFEFIHYNATTKIITVDHFKILYLTNYGSIVKALEILPYKLDTSNIMASINYIFYESRPYKFEFSIYISGNVIDYNECLLSFTSGDYKGKTNIDNVQLKSNLAKDNIISDFKFIIYEYS